MQDEKRGSKQVTNWSAYNKSLCERGKITVFLTPEVTDNWHEQKKRIGSGKRNIYSDSTVLFMATIGEVYGLPYRQTQGFLEQVFMSNGIELRVPNYTILSKRAKDPKVKDIIKKIDKLRGDGEEIYLVVDSSGIKVYGEYEWKVKKHGKEQRRKWRKLHIGIDMKSRKVVSHTLTSNDVHDGMEFGKLLDGSKEHGRRVSRLYADAAYSWHAIFDRLEDEFIMPRIPLPKNSVISGEDVDEAIMVMRPRDRALLEIYDAGGVEEWKKSTDYHQRSLVENFFSRFKTIFGEKMVQRRDDIREFRASVRCLILNKFADLGLPQYA